MESTIISQSKHGNVDDARAILVALDNPVEAFSRI
jgi:hypothetical protein